jgi:hypothetical protein
VNTARFLIFNQDVVTPSTVVPPILPFGDYALEVSRAHGREQLRAAAMDMIEIEAVV